MTDLELEDLEAADRAAGSVVQSAEPPDSWLGPKLSRPISSYKNGQAYMDLVQQNQTGTRGFMEELTDPEAKDMPFVGAISEVPYLFGVADTAKKLLNDEAVDEEKLIDLNQYLEYSKRKENATLGSKVLDVIQGSLSFGAEISAMLALEGVGMALLPTGVVTAGAGTAAGGGLMAAGAAIGAKTLATKTATKAAQLAISKLVNRTLGKAAAVASRKVMTSAIRGNATHQVLGEAVQNAVLGTATKYMGKSAGTLAAKIIGTGANLESRGLVGSLLNPNRVVQSYANRRLQDVLNEGDETKEMAIAKSFLDVNFEIASEFSGVFLGKAAGRLFSPQMKKWMVQSAVLSHISKKVKTPNAQAAWGVLNSMGINGALEEMGEERVGGFLRGLFGVEGNAGLINAVRQSGWEDGEQFATEAIAFSVLPIMANGLNRVSGGQSFAERAKAMDEVKKLAFPDAQVYVKTPEQRREQAKDLKQRIDDEETFWFSDTPLKFLEHVFGKKRLSPVQSILSDLGVANMRVMHDAAQKKDPNNPEAGIQAIDDYLSRLQDLHTEGINSKQDVEDFNAGVKSGDVRVYQADKKYQRRYYVTKEGMTKQEVVDLAQQTGISAITRISEQGERNAVADLTSDRFLIPWDDLDAAEQKSWSVVEHTEDYGKLQELYELRRKSIPLSKAQNRLVLPTVLTGTDAELAAAGYPVKAGTPVFEKSPAGEDLYAIHANATTSADGSEVDYATGGDVGDWTEDQIEAHYKQKKGITLAPAVEKFIETRRQELAQIENPSESEKFQLSHLDPADPVGRFEYAIKAYYMNVMGYQHHADVGTRLIDFGKIDIPADMDHEMRAIVGLPLLESLAFQKMPEVKRSPLNEELIRVMNMPGQVKGRAETARKIIDQASDDAVVNRLKEALNQDLRLKVNRDAVLDLLNKETFSAETEKMQEMKAIRKAIKNDEWHIGARIAKTWIKKPEEVSARKLESRADRPVNVASETRLVVLSEKAPKGSSKKVREMKKEYVRAKLVSERERLNRRAERLGRMIDIQRAMQKNVPDSIRDRIFKVKSADVRRNITDLESKLNEVRQDMAMLNEAPPRIRVIAQTQKNEPRDDTGSSIREDRFDQEYDDFSPPVFSEEELRRVVPGWLVNADQNVENALSAILKSIYDVQRAFNNNSPDLAEKVSIARRKASLQIESPLDAWLEDPDGLDPLDLMRMVSHIRIAIDQPPLQDTEEKLDELFYSKQKLLAESGIYKRQQATTLMPRNRSRAGQEVPVAPTTAALPFDINMGVDVSEQDMSDEEQNEVAEQLGIAESFVQPSVAKAELGMISNIPRNFTLMAPLDSRSIREQLTVIVKYGQQSLSRAVEYIQHGFRNPVTEIDQIDIPRTRHTQPEAVWLDPVKKTYVYRDMINWVNHVETKLLKTWDVQAIPYLNKGRRAALQEDVDAEGAILVVDNGPRSLNQRLGSPIDRMFHALVHGMYPRGKVYADWYKTPVEGALNPDGSVRRSSPSRTYVATPNVNDDEVRGELEETMEQKDFLSPSGYAVPPIERYSVKLTELNQRLSEMTPGTPEYAELESEIASYNRQRIALENRTQPVNVQVVPVVNELRTKIQAIFAKQGLSPDDVRQSSTGKYLMSPELARKMRLARKQLTALARVENMTLEGLFQVYRDMGASEIPSLGESPQVHRGAVLPVTSEEIVATKGNEPARQALEMKIHDFMVHNRIRRVILAGFDQVNTVGRFEYIGKNGDKIIAPKQEVVPAEWEHQFSVVLKNAFGQETRDKALARGDPAQIVYTPETVEAVRKNIEEQEGMQNRSFSASMETSKNLETRILAGVKRFNNNRKLSDLEMQTYRGWIRKTLNGEESGKAFLRRNLTVGDQEAFKGLIGTNTPTFSASIPAFSKDIMTGQREENIPVPEWMTTLADRLNFHIDARVTENGQDPTWQLTLNDTRGTFQVSETESPKAWIDKIQAARARTLRTSTPVEIETPTESGVFSNQQEFDLRTQSAQAVTNIYQQISPIFAATGMHKAMLDIMHEMNAIQFEQTKLIEKMKEGLGLLGNRKNLPSGHADRVNDVLRAVGAVLDNSSRIPIGWDTSGNVTWDPRSPDSYGQSWDAYMLTHGLGMKTYAGLINEMRAKYNKVREDYNAVVQNLSGEEWIKFLNDYLPHIYEFRNDQHRDEFMASMREESKRALGRKFETYQQAAEEKRLVPKTMNALDLYDMYNQTVWSAAKNKALANMMSMVRDIDGAPLVVPVKLGGYGPKTHLLVDQNVLRETARNLADYLGDTFDPSKDLAEEIARMTSGINLEAHDFERLESPLTKSIDFFLVRRGTPSNLLKMVLNHGRMDNDFVKAIEHLNGWSKFLMLSASAFHPFALAESLAAVFGLTRSNPWFHLKKTRHDLKAILTDARDNPTLYSHWVRNGLIIPTKSPDVDTGMISRDIEFMLTKLERSSPYVSKVFTPGVKALRWYKRKVDKWLWNELHPSMKLYSAEFVSNQWKSSHPNATPEEITAMEKQAATYLNNAFGGLDWATYTWATPRVMQWMHLGIFAPDWTFAAAEISALTRLPILNRMHTTTLSPLAKSEMLRRYWPGMIGLTLIAVPNFIQMLIYAAFGDPDREDVPFNFMNEMNRKTYIDFTPLFRHLPLYDGGPSGKRRIYMRWGKQAYEISEGWLEDPAMILRKSSSMVRQAFEQVTGQTVSGWDLPYKDQGLLGIVNVEGSFAESRLGSIAKNFMPVTLQSVAKGEFAAFIAPGARGMSQGGAVKAMSQVLEAYVYGHHLPADQRPLDLHAIVADVISATWRNGLDPEIAFRQAKSSIAGKYYRKFFEAMNSNDEAAMDEAAEKVLMLGSGIKQFEDSMTRRQEAIGKELTPEIAEAIKQSLIRVQNRE